MNIHIEKSKTSTEILSILSKYEDVIVSMGNGEPDAILTLIDDNPSAFTSLKIHQILEMKYRKYMNGQYPHIRYISYFMNKFARSAFLNGKCELVPNHFHQMPRLLESVTNQPVVVCQTSPMDQDGYFSLGATADYTTHFIGKAPFVIQVNENVPTTNGENRIHISQVEGMIFHNQPLYELPNVPVQEIDKKIAGYIAERIDNGATLQVGIGGIPNAVVGMLKNHRDLGVHTEMLTDGIHELAQLGVVTGAQKKTYKHKIITTFALGSKPLYDFMNHNDHIIMLSVDKVNDPRVIAQEDNMVAINATTEVDFYGQCASETVGGRYYSSSGGQADFGTGVRFAKNGKGFICLYSTAKNETISRIRPMLAPGSVVTTSKNDVDYIVTEYGITQLKGKSIFERTKSLIEIAHPNFREELTFEAKKMGLWI